MLSDVVQAREKCQELQKLVGDERQIVAMFLLRLMEFNRDRLHERLGYASLFDFCRRGLGLCESTAGRRIKAVKAVERFPAAVDYLRDGRLCVSRLLLLADVLTTENASDLFEKASRKSLQEIELLAASANPRPAPPARVQKFPQPRNTPAAPVLAFDAPAPGAHETSAPPALVSSQAEPERVPVPDPAAVPDPAPEPTPLPRAPRRARVRPTSEREYSARFPVSREWVGKLELAKKLGSHVVPTGDPVAILELALDLFIEKHGKRRGAIAPQRPRASVASRKNAPAVAATPEKTPENTEPATKDRFTAEDRRTIWKRDGGRCVWKMDSGETCGSEWQLEVDHVEAAAKGGASDPASARLLCRKHNDQHARETFGEAFVQEKKRKASKSVEGVVSGVTSSSGGNASAP